MSAIIESENSVLNAQRYAIINALSSGTSSLSNARKESLIIERPNNYNPVVLFLGEVAKNNHQDFNLAYRAVNKKILGFDNLYQSLSDSTDYSVTINIASRSTTKVNISSADSDSSFEKDEITYKVKTVLSQVNSLEKDNERVASRFLMRSIERKLKVKDVFYLNELLKNMSVMDFSPRCLVSALRSTYRVKHSLFMWRFALQSVEERLSAKGLDSHAWLIGLTNDRK